MKSDDLLLDLIPAAHLDVLDIAVQPLQSKQSPAIYRTVCQDVVGYMFHTKVGDSRREERM